MSNKIWTTRHTLTIGSTETIPKGTPLQRIGAGIDGYVLKPEDGNRVLKILKGDIPALNARNLMTYNKARYFRDALKLHRITKPLEVVFNEDGIYKGYVMEYIDDVTISSKHPLYRKPGDFTCRELIAALEELREDFIDLSRNSVRALDINRGSYLFADDFLHLCDMDKYQIVGFNPINANSQTLNYIIARFLAYEMKKQMSHEEVQSHSRTFDRYVNKSSGDPNYISGVIKEVKTSTSEPLSEYTKHVRKRLLHN